MRTFLLTLLILFNVASFACATETKLKAGHTGLDITGPTTNRNGSPLLDLVGYKVYYFAAGGTPTDAQSFMVPNPAHQVRVPFSDIIGLTDAHTAFRVTAYDDAIPPNESLYFPLLANPPEFREISNAGQIPNHSQAADSN